MAFDVGKLRDCSGSIKIPTRKLRKCEAMIMSQTYRHWVSHAVYSSRKAISYSFLPDLPHTGGPNWGADIRVMIYFRLTFGETELSEEQHEEEHRRDMLYDFHSSFRDIRDRLEGEKQGR